LVCPSCRSGNTVVRQGAALASRQKLRTCRRLSLPPRQSPGDSWSFGNTLILSTP
jgi:transposase-like protein